MTPHDATRAYVASLEPEYQRIYAWAENEVHTIRDTLSGEFQVAARIVDAFAGNARHQQLDPWEGEVSVAVSGARTAPTVRGDTPVVWLKVKAGPAPRGLLEGGWSEEIPLENGGVATRTLEFPS